MPVSMSLLRARARRHQITVSDDHAAGVIRLTADPGRCFGADLHELCHHYELDGEGRTDAMISALDDIDAYPTEPCADLDCEWCADALADQAGAARAAEEPF